jgi:hypothetical protein
MSVATIHRHRLTSLYKLYTNTNFINFVYNYSNELYKNINSRFKRRLFFNDPKFMTYINKVKRSELYSNLQILSTYINTSSDSFIYLYSIDNHNYIIKIGGYNVYGITGKINNLIIEYLINSYLNLLYFLNITPHIILSYNAIKLYDITIQKNLLLLFNETNLKSGSTMTFYQLINTYYNIDSTLSDDIIYKSFTVILFQLIYTLECFARIKLKHNDLHLDNVLILLDDDNIFNNPNFQVTEYHSYEVTYKTDYEYFGNDFELFNIININNGNKRYVIPYLGITLMIFDFDRSILYNSNNSIYIYNKELYTSFNIPEYKHINVHYNEYIDINKILLQLFEFITYHNNNIIIKVLENLYGYKYSYIIRYIKTINNYILDYTIFNKEHYFTAYNFIYLNNFEIDASNPIIFLNPEQEPENVTKYYSTANSLKYWNGSAIDAQVTSLKSKKSYSSTFSLLKNNKRRFSAIEPTNYQNLVIPTVFNNILSIKTLNTNSSYTNNQFDLMTNNENNLTPNLATTIVNTSKVNTSKLATTVVNTSKVNTPNLATTIINTSKGRTPKLATTIVNTSKVNTPKLATAVVNTSKVNTPNLATTVVNTSKGRTPKLATTVVNTSKGRTPKLATTVVNTSKGRTPKLATTIVNTSKGRTPKLATAVVNTSKGRTPKLATTIVNTSKVNTPKLATAVVNTSKGRTPKLATAVVNTSKGRTPNSPTKTQKNSFIIPTYEKDWKKKTKAKSPTKTQKNSFIIPTYEKDWKKKN